ncbi:MAG: hypothetical protein EXS63_09355 [Candidatus Omnitrophica bacterium]|nr:hypothetical protein [Candidatus Omnitrophota bacterium]
MVRKDLIPTDVRRHKAVGRKQRALSFLLSAFFFLPSVLCLLIFAYCLLPPAFCFAADADGGKNFKGSSFAAHEAETAQKSSAPTASSSDSKKEIKSFSLKLMVVNPSKTNKQIYKMKYPLPSEVQPQHVLSKDGLGVGYDANLKSYYMEGNVEIDPGQSIVKVIVVEDVWYIPEDKLKELSKDAQTTFEKLLGTSFQGRAMFLSNNIDVMLGQILETQNDENLTAEEHISAYRQNKEKFKEAELDLALLRRLEVMATTGNPGLFGKDDSDSKKEDNGLLGQILKNAKANSRKNVEQGAVPAWVIWRVILGILFFVGISAMMFHLSWSSQMRTMEKRKKEKLKPGSDPHDIFPEMLKPSTPKISEVLFSEEDPIYIKNKFIDPTLEKKPRNKSA